VKKTNLILLAALLCTPIITRAVTVISSLPYTITAPGSYILINNLTANGSDGIDVTASNVSIDLSGCTITALHPNPDNGYIGIRVYGGSDVTIQNGTITGFTLGIWFEDSSQRDVAINVRLINLPQDGILVMANDSLIENCLIVGPGANGTSAGITIINAAAIRIKDNRISEFTDGIISEVSEGSAALTGNYEANCTSGLNLQTGDKYQDNITTNCTTPVSGGTEVGSDNG
jgi:nitrous oxidase accessory protein NosD